MGVKKGLLVSNTDNNNELYLSVKLAYVAGVSFPFPGGDWTSER